MKTFKHAQTDWKLFLLFPVIPVLFYRILHDNLGNGAAILIGIAIGALCFLLLSKYFTSVVTYKDTYLLLNKGRFKEEIKVNYSDIKAISFSYDKFMNLYIYTADKEVKLPPPLRVDRAEELFQWLSTKNPAIKMKMSGKKRKTTPNPVQP